MNRFFALALSVRAARSPVVAKRLGFDVVAWAKEGLVDLVVGSSFYQVDRDIAVSNWIAALKAANPAVAFLPCIDMIADGGAKDLLDRFMNIARYRYVADRFYKGGAEGIYLFNAPYLGKYDPSGLTNAGEDTFGMICAEGLSPEAISGKPMDEVKPRHDFPPKGAPRDVPPLLTTFDGKAMKTAEEWENVRRPELLEKFLRQMYGRRPEGADNPLQAGSVSYHMRTGEHDLTPYDWARYMDFADANGWMK